MLHEQTRPALTVSGPVGRGTHGPRRALVGDKRVCASRKTGFIYLENARRPNMPASGVSMDAGSGMGLPPPPPPPAEAKPEGWANPAVVGLMGFGTTTMLAGLSNMPAPYVNGFAANWVVFGMALFFGGIAQLLAGVIALRKGNLFAGSAFVGYGSFWLAYFYTLNSAGGAALATTPVLAYGLAGFSFIWMMFTFTFMINAPKHGWGILLVFVLRSSRSSSWS